jgi:predicted MFS family arabinose efflux permease
VVPIVLAVVLLGAFGVIETHTSAPLMPFRIFANRNRSGTYIIMLCIGTAMFSMFFFLSQFLQNILGYSPIMAGLAFLPMTGGIVLAAGLASRLVGKIRVPLLLGPAVAAIGLGLLSRLGVHSGYGAIVVPLILISLGVGFCFVPLTLTAVSGVRHEETGLASALLNTAQQVGGGLGLAVLATIAIATTKSTARQLALTAHGRLTSQLQETALAHGYSRAFLAGSLIALVALVVSALVIRVENVESSGGNREFTAGLG